MSDQKLSPIIPKASLKLPEDLSEAVAQIEEVRRLGHGKPLKKLIQVCARAYLKTDDPTKKAQYLRAFEMYYLLNFMIRCYNAGSRMKDKHLFRQAKSFLEHVKIL